MNPWIDVAPMVVGVIFMLLTAGTLLLWPLSRRLASLVDVVIEEKQRVPPPTDVRTEEFLERMDARLTRVEQTQSFLSALQAPRRETMDGKSDRPE